MHGSTFQAAGRIPKTDARRPRGSAGLLTEDRVGVAVATIHLAGQPHRRRPRVKGFWTAMAEELSDKLGCAVTYIAEPTLAFYVVAKDPQRRDQVREVLDKIAVRHTPGVSQRRLVSTAG